MLVIKGLEWTFDTQAEQYGKMRPAYTNELYNDIFKAIQIDSSSVTVEIGIGGGQATLPFLKTGCKLTAVEYGENLSELCRIKFQNYPNFTVINEKFEDYEFQSNSCDLIYSASAFHWIPEEVGYPKVYAMLKTGGIFARFANHPYKDESREELWSAIQKLYAIYMQNSKAPNEYTIEQAKKRGEIAMRYGFADIKYSLYHSTRSFTAKEYVDLLYTYSDHIALPDDIRNTFFNKVEETINDFGGEITIYDTMDLQLAKKL